MNTLRPRKRIGQQRAPHGAGRLDLLPCPTERMHERGAHSLLMPWPARSAIGAAVKATLARYGCETLGEYRRMTQGRPLPPKQAGVCSGRAHGV